MKSKLSTVFIVLFILCGCGTVTSENQISNTESESAETYVTEDKPEEINTDYTEIIETDPIDEVEEIVNNMTLEEKIGQMFICAFRKVNDKDITKLNDNTKAVIENYNIGGVVLFSENIKSQKQVSNYIESLQNISKLPLFIAIDEEGGRVVRTSNLDVPIIPSAYAMGRTADVDKTYDYAAEISKYIGELGFNMDFAPVADINTNPKNFLIGDRAFGADSDIVSDMVPAFVKGLEDNGIYSSLKHFPGHGDTTIDSHNDMSTIDFDIDRLREVELKPFKAGIDAGASAVMAGHISTPNITGNNEPAIFSEYLLTDILRGEMGFDKLIVTDALDMGAVTKYYTPEEAAVKAVKAGVDILVMPIDFVAAYDGLLNAVKNNEISEERINQSVIRIIKIKKNNIL